MKSLYLIIFLYSCTVFSQVSAIGVNTPLPTEGFDADGTLRVRDLPLNGSLNSINTLSNGELSPLKNQSFNAVNTVVADANGVLGIVEGVTETTLPDIKVISYTSNISPIDNNTITNSITVLDKLAVYFEANSTDTTGGTRPLRFCLIGIDDNVIVNQRKLGSGGAGYGGNQVFYGVQPNPYLPNDPLFLSTLPAYSTSTSLSYNPSSPYSVWIQINREVPNIGNNDFFEYIFALINSREVYRLTGVVNKAIPGEGTKPINTPAQVSIFIERLSDQ